MSRRIDMVTREHSHSRQTDLSTNHSAATSPRHELHVFAHADMKDETEAIYLAEIVTELYRDLGGARSKAAHTSLDPTELAMHIAVDAEESLYAGVDGEYVLQGELDHVKAYEIIGCMRHERRFSEKSVLKLIYQASEILDGRPNMPDCNIPKGGSAIIVGDLHGQLEDLLHILDTFGPPSDMQKYVFNGDFVDRGSQGVEIMIILLTLTVAWPEYVFLNRGNHEDVFICRSLPLLPPCLPLCLPSSARHPGFFGCFLDPCSLIRHCLAAAPTAS